nr:diacylglycerol kinase kappa-like [Loxodonta africana]
MPGSHLEHRAQLLLAQLDQMEVTETEPEAPEPRPGPVVKVAQDPSLSRELAPAPCSGVYSAPVLAPELHSTPPITSPAPEPAPDGEPAGGVDSHPGSPPELAPRPLADVNPTPATTLELHTTPAISSPAPALAPDEEPAGGSESYPGPPSESTPGPLATVSPAPAPTPELDVAQALLQLHHQHPMDNWMERWIPTLDYFQNRNLDHQLMSILHCSNTEAPWSTSSSMMSFNCGSRGLAPWSNIGAGYINRSSISKLSRQRACWKIGFSSLANTIMGSWTT